MSADEASSPKPKAGTSPVSHEEDVIVARADEKTFTVEFSIPNEMRGHNFKVELFHPSSDALPTGPFRFEYVLGSEFVIYEKAIPVAGFEPGYSHFCLTPELSGATVVLKYENTKPPEVLREATMRFVQSNSILQRLIIDIDERELSTAIRFTSRLVADFLDAVSLVKRVPVSIHHIDVSAPGSKYRRRYLTFPYTQQTLTAEDLREVQNIPPQLRGAVRLFREGVNSSRPHYRLLCLYRIREVLKHVQAETDLQIRDRGGVPTRPVRALPADELTRRYFPQFVGKRFGAFLDHVRDEYRLAIAHGNLDEYFKLILDPADVRIDHRIDFTNAVLVSVVVQLIRDEAEIINRVAAVSA